MKNAKWWMELLFAVGPLALVAPVAWGDATVGDVVARQRYPWNGLVDIACTVTGITGEATSMKFAVAAVDEASGTEQEVSHVRLLKAGEETDDLTVVANGNYELVWDARADLGAGLWSNLVVRVTVAADDPTPRGGQLWEGGPYWADRNIGAENPWDYGLYFWWGDTIGYRREGNAWVASDGSAENFWFTSGAPTNIKTPGQLRSEGWITAASILVPKHDAAQMHWGGTWRMPTDQELRDLRNKCDWKWKTMCGVNGYRVLGRGSYANNSIFLPAAGYGSWGALSSTGVFGYYWSSVPRSDSNSSYGLYFTSREIGMNGCYREIGRSIRPVREFAE